MNNKQTILAITGSDGTGGSGVQADIRCISELGGTVTSVVTSITVQNTLGIQEFYDLPAAIVRKQIEAIFNDLQPQIVKIGLIRQIDVVATIAEMMQKYHPRYIIYAPVQTSTHGDQLAFRPSISHSSARPSQPVVGGTGLLSQLWREHQRSYAPCAQLSEPVPKGLY